MIVTRYLPLSLLLNLVLAGFLIWRGRSTPSDPGPRPRAVDSRGSGTSRVPESTIEPATWAPTEDRFHWTQLDTTEWFAYRDGLLGIGCPPDVVRDILKPLVLRLYAEHYRELVRPYSERFWDVMKPPLEQTLEGLKKSVQASESEKDDLLERLLGGLEGTPKSANQNEWSDYQLSFLSEELRPEVVQRLQNLEAQRRELRQKKFPGSQERKEAYRSLQEQFDSELLEVLSPEELLELKLRRSPQARWRELDSVDLTRDELRTLIQTDEEARTKAALEGGGDAEIRAATQSAVESVLGPDRPETLRRAEDSDFRTGVRMADRLGIPRESAAELWKSEAELFKSAREVAEDRTLTESERRDRLIAYRERMVDLAGKALGGDRGRDTWERTMSGWLKQMVRTPEVDPVAELERP